MTAEIAVMNKSAVALAADSAVTIQIGGGHKIYMTNKLFTLSKYHPVGVMIYGEAELLGVPWDTVVKAYRKKLADKKFGTLRDYANDFIRFMENAKLLFPESLQKDFFKISLSGYYELMKKEIDDKIKKLTQKDKITKSEIKKIVDSAINKQNEDIGKLELLINFSRKDETNLIVKYADIIEKVKDNVFVKLPMNETSRKKLKEIAGRLFARKIFQKSLCGVVIAGFGNNEIFPHLSSFQIEGIVNGKAKFKDPKDYTTDQDTTSRIIPFAQTEMVATFMEGIDPDYNKVIFGGLRTLLTEKYPDYVVKEIQDLSKEKQEVLASKLKKVGKGVLDEFEHNMGDYSQKAHINPIVTAVSFLPKEELAVMAETLVNLTSFKRKISVDVAETVGGPIDVAVISKGDGFIWIKRKHYFEQNLNTCFVANYFREK